MRGYKVGEYAFGYLPGKQYRGQRLRRFYPTNPELLARLARQHEQIREAERRNRLPIHEAWESWQHTLTIDIEQARRSAGWPAAARNPFDTQWLLVERLHRRIRLQVDDFGAHTI